VKQRIWWRFEPATFVPAFLKEHKIFGGELIRPLKAFILVSFA